MKDHLIFDTTDANTIVDSDSVGAYIRSDDGTLIEHETVNSVERLAVDATLKDGAGTALTSTLVGSDQALDVNVVSGVNVEVDLDHADDSVAIGDGTTIFDAAVQDVAAGAGHAGFASMAVHDATLSALGSADGDFEHLRVDANGALWVAATDLDIRDIDHATDDIRLGDGTTLITGTTVGSDHGLDVYTLNDPSTADTAIATNANTLGVADTAEDVVASPLANRKTLFIYNNGNRTAYIGESGVAAADGFPLSPGSYIELKAGPSVDIEWVSSNTSQELRTLELS